MFWFLVMGCRFLVGLPLFHGFWLWVVGFGVRFALLYLLRNSPLEKVT